MRLLVKQIPLKATLVLLAVMIGVGLALPAAAYAATPAAWTANPAIDETVSWQSVAWSPDLKIFVAVSTNKVMVSSDGIKWEEHATPTDGPNKLWRSIAWSPDKKVFAVVGSSNPTSSTVNTMSSTDGINWTLGDPLTDNRAWIGVTWANNQFVAVPVSMGTMTSPDGKTWTYHMSASAPNSSRSIAWSAQDGYVATSSTPSPGRMYTSTDAVTWTQQSTAQGITIGGWQGVTYSPEKDLFVAVGTNGIMTSNNGVNWTNQTSTVTSLRSITWSPENGEFVAVGAGGIVTSPDGVAWTPVTSPAANTWASITWSSQLSRYVATSIDGTNRTMVGAVPTVPSAPLNLSASLNGKNVNLSWNISAFDGNTAITGYRIERSINGGAFETIVTNTGSPATMYIDTTAAVEMSYTYRIYALNAQGQSIASNVAAIQIPVGGANTSGELANTGQNTGMHNLLASLLIAASLGIILRRRISTSFKRM